MLGSCEVIAFAAPQNPGQARSFYQTVLGLHLVAEEPYALVFDAHGTMLRIAKVQQLAPTQYTVLGWKVSNIRAAVAGLAKEGMGFERYPGMSQDGLGIWESPSGAKVAWFKDPDGNTLSLAEFSA